MPTAVLLLTAGWSSAQTLKSGTKYCVERFGQRDYNVILKDVSEEQKKKLTTDAAFRKEQTDSLRQLLALSCEAEKRGLANEETNAVELDSIRSEIIATNYDKRLSKAPNGPPFTSVSDAQVVEF